MSKRPWRSRIWFNKPCLYWYGWATLRPFWFGGDEYDWHTVVIGWNLFGQVTIATRHCPQTGKCAGIADDYAEFGEMLRDWPGLDEAPGS